MLDDKMGSFIEMINAISEGIFIVNADGIIEMINPLAANFFGASQESLIGQKWFYFLHDRYREQYEYLFLNWKDNHDMPLNHGPKEVLLNRSDSIKLTYTNAPFQYHCSQQIVYKFRKKREL